MRLSAQNIVTSRATRSGLNTSQSSSHSIESRNQIETTSKTPPTSRQPARSPIIPLTSIPAAALPRYLLSQLPPTISDPTAPPLFRLKSQIGQTPDVSKRLAPQFEHVDIDRFYHKHEHVRWRIAFYNQKAHSFLPATLPRQATRVPRQATLIFPRRAPSDSFRQAESRR